VNKVREAVRCPMCRKSFLLPSELINGLLRKVSLRDLNSRPKLLQVGDLVLNPTTYDATRSGKEIALSPIESRLLGSLMRRSGRAVSRKVLIRAIWGSDGYVEKNRLDVFICLLRNKVDRDHKVKLIKTIRNLGFVIRNPAKAR
jgi:two-component system, OmpR family, response regulator